MHTGGSVSTWIQSWQMRTRTLRWSSPVWMQKLVYPSRATSWKLSLALRTLLLQLSVSPRPPACPTLTMPPVLFTTSRPLDPLHSQMLPPGTWDRLTLLTAKKNNRSDKTPHLTTIRPEKFLGLASHAANRIPPPPLLYPLQYRCRAT